MNINKKGTTNLGNKNKGWTYHKDFIAVATSDTELCPLQRGDTSNWRNRCWSKVYNLLAGKNGNYFVNLLFYKITAIKYFTWKCCNIES